MELWIRSQDKYNLVKADKIAINTIHLLVPNENRKYKECDECCIEVGNVEVGKYASEQRCLEVLDEIQKLLILSPYKELKEKRQGCKLLHIDNDFIPIEEYPLDNVVYQMPKE